METLLRALIVDAGTGFYKIVRFPAGRYYGPVDLGLYLAATQNSLNFGTGLLAGSIIPGSNRLIFTGFSPCWGGFYISSMGGAGLVFDNLGINLVAITGRAAGHSILCLNRNHGEEIEVKLEPVDTGRVWREGRGGVYALLDHTYQRFGEAFATEPRILATGPAALATDFGAICSVPISDGKLSFVDTWAGRGGLGSKLVREHGVAAVIYGGTFIDEDFRERTVADEWFRAKYDQKLAAKDFEATTKYRFDPKFGTGGTLGVNFSTLGGRMLSFNYTSIYMEEQQRLDIHQKFVVDHYLKQFNEETIATKQQKTCGEPCSAVCKKMKDHYKKDYEPYQTMGPLCGIFDQRAAERLNHRADQYGFDAISAGGVVAWLLECLHHDRFNPEELGVAGKPVFTTEGFRLEADSLHNAELGTGILDAIIASRGILDLKRGARRMARLAAKDRGKEVLDSFVFVAFGRGGWMVPNQYWTPGVLLPMPIMGKYYMHYGNEFLPPRELGRKSAERLRQELMLDNLGVCRFHRGWAEEMVPEIMEQLFGIRQAYQASIASLASRIASRNASQYWESERNLDYIQSFLVRQRDVEHDTSPVLASWIDRFRSHRDEAGLEYWYEMHKGIHESLREF